MPHYRLNLQGVVYSAEQFQHGVTVTSGELLTAVADDAEAAIEANLLVSGFLTIFPPGVTWNLLTVSQLGGPGDPVVASTTRSLSAAGSAGAEGLPAQCAVVVSHLTAGAGSRNRGRMYLPPPAANAILTNGRLESTATAAIADAVQATYEALVTAGSTPVVLSEVAGGTSSTISSIRVGDVIDTQRRRRGDLGEVYTSRTISP